MRLGLWGGVGGCAICVQSMEGAERGLTLLSSSMSSSISLPVRVRTLCGMFVSWVDFVGGGEGVRT